MVYCIMRVLNMGFALLIMVLFPNMTSGKMAFTCWKLEKPLLQIALLVVLIIFQRILTNTNRCENKDKLSSDATTRLRDSLNRSSEMSNNDVLTQCITEMKNLRLRNVNKVIIGNSNINSLPNKFDQSRREIVLKYVDVLVIMETKSNLSYRLDRNRNGGGIIIFIRNYIPSRMLTKHVFSDDIEGLFIELNFR